MGECVVYVCVVGRQGRLGGKVEYTARTSTHRRHTAAFSLAVVLADARPAALLALASSEVVFEIVDPPHRLQVLLSRLCSRRIYYTPYTLFTLL